MQRECARVLKTWWKWNFFMYKSFSTEMFGNNKNKWHGKVSSALPITMTLSLLIWTGICYIIGKAYDKPETFYMAKRFNAFQDLCF